MLPQPRSQNKRTKKRASAPPATLATQLKSREIQQEQPKTASDDLLDFFANNDSNPITTNTNAGGGGGEEENPFDVFFDAPTAQGAHVNTAVAGPPNNGVGDKRVSVNTQITQGLFDIWEDFAKDPQTTDAPTKDANAIFSPTRPESNQSQKRQTAPPSAIGSQAAHSNLAAIGEDERKSESDAEEESSSDDAEPKASEKVISSQLTKKTGKSVDKAKSKKGDKEAPAKAKKNVSSNALLELHRGTTLLKYPRRHGFPHFKWVELSLDNRRVQWFSRKKEMSQTNIAIKDIREIRKGQETEVFRKYHQTTLEKASFSIVFGFNYRTLDLVAKSADECELWVRTLNQLVRWQREGVDLKSKKTLDVGVGFRDRNRPKSRLGGGGFVRANDAQKIIIDQTALKSVEKEMEALHKSYHRVSQMAQQPSVSKAESFPYISEVMSEFEERMEELSHEIANTRNTEIAKRDVWRAGVDLAAIEEKIAVISKHLGTDRRRSNLW